MNGQYITCIEIEALWNGHKHIRWELQPGVNILSGVNGVGKSTILNRVIMHLLDINRDTRKNDGVHLTYFPKGWETLWPEFHRQITTYMKVGTNAHDDAPDALTGTVEKRDDINKKSAAGYF